MRKRRQLWLALLVTLPATLFLFDGASSAHLIGAFSEFLAKTQDEFLGGVKNNDQTTQNLKEEIAKTKVEIEKMTPQVQAMEADYKKKEQAEALKLQFYSGMGVDTYANFLLQANDVTDLLYSQKVMEDKLQRDLVSLDRLYQDYRLMQATKGSLDNYEQILELIQNHLQKRQALFDAHPNAKPEELSKVVNDMWSKNAVFLKVQMEYDNGLLNSDLPSYVTQKSSSSPYRLEDFLLNQKGKLRYYFHTDHAYVHFARGDADVILIGTYAAKDSKTIELSFEAGFLDGVMMSNKLIADLKPMDIDYTKLVPDSKGFYVEQMNGYLAIQPMEKAGE